MVKLKKSTWRKCIGIWKALLCFVVRTSRPGCHTRLRHQFTSNQIVHLDRAITCVEDLQRLLKLGQVENLQAPDLVAGLQKGSTALVSNFVYPC